jgi:hypothetical protein
MESLPPSLQDFILATLSLPSCHRESPVRATCFKPWHFTVLLVHRFNNLGTCPFINENMMDVVVETAASGRRDDPETSQWPVLKIKDSLVGLSTGFPDGI